MDIWKRSLQSYTVSLIQWNQYCSDTVTKEAFLRGIGPFPNIVSALNTCNGNRDIIEFKQKSSGTQQWKWTFGDGTDTTINSDVETIRHAYAKSGQYKVFLTVTDAQCSSTDSISVDVFVKQKPVLTADKNVFCGSDDLGLKINGLENLMRYGITYYYYQGQFQFSDGKLAADPFYNFLPGLESTITKIPPRNDSIRLIIYDAVYGCYDTSNYVPVNIAGPVAAFDIQQRSVCADNRVNFTDRSTSTGGVPIAQWIWDYGDGKSDTLFTSQNPVHRYDEPNYYRPTLKVIDTAGCSDYTFTNAHYVESYGPVASFTVSDTVVTPNTAITFTNTTLNYPGGYTQYSWDFGDGKTSTEYSPTHVYDKVGSYTIKLIAFNTYTGCRDTILLPAYIKVKTVVASFNLNTSYPGGKACPPLVANFENTSINALSVLWDFGDGGGYSDNPVAASRTYYQPGVYRAVLYAYGRNGAIDSTVQFITVNGPYGTMWVDTSAGCSPFPVKFASDVKNTISYRWDFGDGEIDAKDSSTAHTYIKPGVYIPRLILRDTAGCPATFELGDTIIVDKLSASITNPGNIVCDSAIIDFKSGTESLARDSLQIPLNYTWNFGAGVNASGTSNDQATAQYRLAGTYPLSLKVTSAFGCVKELRDTVLVAATPISSIVSRDNICEDSTILFTANSNQQDLEWRWNLSDGRTYNTKDAGDILFSDPGNYTITLLSKNQYQCVDTVTRDLVIHPKPLLSITPGNSTVCLGDDITLEASGGNTYQWTSSDPSYGASGNKIIVKPADPITFYVQAMSEFGCRRDDSVKLKISYPFTIAKLQDATICRGEVIDLQTNGAVSYAWFPASGLSTSQGNKVKASPDTTTSYMVVGYGADACFTDTARFQVTVNPLPEVEAGNTIQATVGSTLELKPTLSNDVTTIAWNPSTYLNCFNCATPTVTPRSDITYRVRVSNQYGCESSDTVSIRLSCPNTSLFIPNTFTPNGDGLNDIFFPQGKGIRVIKYLRIFNRWGELVFEKQNFNINDDKNGWNGTFKGKILPPDVFVYDTEMVCDNNQIIKQYGNLMILR
jgi:gliding motility-associated-like protein